MNTYEIVRLHGYDREAGTYESEINGGEFVAEDDVVASFSFGVELIKLFPTISITHAFLSPNMVIGIEIVSGGKSNLVYVRRKN